MIALSLAYDRYRGMRSHAINDFLAFITSFLSLQLQGLTAHFHMLSPLVVSVGLHHLLSKRFLLRLTADLPVLVLLCIWISQLHVVPSSEWIELSANVCAKAQSMLTAVCLLPV